jgi:hypothetical protein
MMLKKSVLLKGTASAVPKQAAPTAPPLCRRQVSHAFAVASEIGRDFSPDIKAKREAIHRSPA